MRSATSNQDVIRTCEAKIRESIKTIGWFEESVRELQVRGGGGSDKSLPNPPSQANPTASMSVPPGAAPSYVQPSGYGANPRDVGRVNARDPALPIGAGGQALYGQPSSSSAKTQFTNLGAF